MKKAMLILASTTLFALSATATAGNSYLSDDELVELCEAVASNKTMKLNKTMKKYRVNFQTLADGLVCNGKDIATFAALNGADKTARLIVRRTNLDAGTLLSKAN